MELSRGGDGEEALSRCVHTLRGLPNTSTPTYCETNRVFSVSSPKLHPHTIGVTETQGHFPSLSTNICGAAPTCLVLTLLHPSSGLPRGGARAEKFAGTMLTNRCRAIKLAIKSSNETFWKDTKQVKQRGRPVVAPGGHLTPNIPENERC